MVKETRSEKQWEVSASKDGTEGVTGLLPWSGGIYKLIDKWVSKEGESGTLAVEWSIEKKVEKGKEGEWKSWKKKKELWKLW